MQAVPAGVAETLRRRLARLSSDCVRLLDHAAVIGRDIDVGLLATGRRRRRSRSWRCWMRRGRRVCSPERLRPCASPTICIGRRSSLALPGQLAPRSTWRSAGRCRLRAANTSAARIAAHLLAGGPERNAKGWSTRSSPRVRQRRAWGMTTPAPTTCARCMSWTNSASPQVRSAHSCWLDLAATHERAGDERPCDAAVSRSWHCSDVTPPTR